MKWRMFASPPFIDRFKDVNEFMNEVKELLGKGQKEQKGVRGRGLRRKENKIARCNVKPVNPKHKMKNSSNGSI